MTPEGRVLADVLRYLHRRGLFAWRNTTGCYQAGPGRWIRYGLVGSSDVLGLLPGGRFLAVECKASAGRLRPEQAAFLDRVRGTGGLALVVRSARELDAALAAAGYGVDAGPLFASHESGGTHDGA